MAQAKRSQFAHYLKLNNAYVREGIGVEALSMAYNPQVDTFKTILRDDAESVFKNYDIQSSVSNKRIYRDDDIYDALDEARRTANCIETKYLELDMGKTNGGAYVSTEYDVLLVIDEFLGEDATISYNLYYKNPVQGTSTISDGVPSFTPSAVSL